MTHQFSDPRRVHVATIKGAGVGVYYPNPVLNSATLFGLTTTAAFSVFEPAVHLNRSAIIVGIRADPDINLQVPIMDLQRDNGDEVMRVSAVEASFEQGFLGGFFPFHLPDFRIEITSAGGGLVSCHVLYQIQSKRGA